jgi:hypothetical protein
MAPMCLATACSDRYSPRAIAAFVRPCAISSSTSRSRGVSVANRLSRRGRQTLLVLHYVTSLGWLGGGFAQLTLNLTALVTADPALRHAAHEVAHIFDVSMFTVLSLGSATTGILLSVRSKWGLFGYWWVVAKLIATVILIVVTPLFVGGRIRAAIAATATGPGAAGYPHVRAELLVSSVTIVTTLILVTVVSVVKLSGRTPLVKAGLRASRPPRGKPVNSIARWRN